MKMHYAFVEDAPNWRLGARSGPSSASQSSELFYTVMTGSTRPGVPILGRTLESHGERQKPQISRPSRNSDLIILESLFFKAHRVRL